MKNEEIMWKMSKLSKVSQLFTLESMAVSLFAMVLIFGLGFIFPSINPYVVIKWIVYVTGVYFLFAIVGNWVRRYMMMRLMNGIKEVKEVKEVAKAKVSKKK